MKHPLLKSLGYKPRLGRVCNCICGKDFYVNPSRIKPQGNYCSRLCYQKSTQKKDNRTCFVCKSTFYRTPSQEKWRGKGKFCSRKCQGKWKGENQAGEGNHMWKGEKVGYSPLHRWVRKNKGSAENQKCIDCKKQAKEWSNVDRKYKRDLKHFVPRCISCHRKYDKQKKEKK